ncbi:hypothetical protein MLD38_029774 [Melastoma candidum]|uniref:Uncharacterized protein n=1 Tax=Melastoma candidum TaxID=119954 RepID=A0ACB9N741_9MYRT|nr:hypothetical protein MLD38_029774 [Melastoma candidum]
MMEVDGEPTPRLQKISISGATLASLLHSAAVSSSSDSVGLLFGHTSLLSPPSLSDYPTPTPAPSSSSSSAVVTSFLSSSLPHLLPPSPTPSPSPSPLLGVFSSRRRSQLIPSLRDSSLLLSPPFDHPALPRVLLLLTTPPPSSSNSASAAAALIHTHEYKAFQFFPSSGKFEAVSVEIVNVGGLGFRGSYGSFRSIEGGYGGLEAKGFERLVGDDAERYRKGVEGAYERMLMTVERLGREVEKSNAAVYEMEKRNSKLRAEIAEIKGVVDA